MTPEFRAPQHLAAVMRGFDLGDDEALLRRELPPLKRGVLLYRAGLWEEARAELAQADGPAAKFLESFCRARLETCEAALTSLPSGTDDDLDEATLTWGRAELLWATGSLDKAESALTSAAALGAARELVRLRYGLGKFEEALQSYALLGREEPVLGALLYTALGRLDEARTELKTATAEQRDKASRDPRLAALKLVPAPVRERRGSLWLLSEADSQLYSDKLRARYAGPWTLGLNWSEELWTWCQEMAVETRVLALGPASCKRAGGDLSPALVEIGASLHLAPNLEVPPPLWPRVEWQDVEQALESWARVRRPRLTLPSRLRAFMGYREATFVPNPFTGEWQEAGPHELDRHWGFNPCMDSYPWGGAYSDDPWPEAIPPQPDLQLKLSAKLDEIRQQASGGVSTFTMRTLATRSQITTEYHPGGCYVWELRYHPNPWPEVIEGFNSRLGLDYPTDLPVDVVGALYGFTFATLPTLWQSMEAESDPSARAGWFDILAATGHNDLRTIDRLRRDLDHSSLDVRAALANVAVRYNWFFVLHDLVMAETDEAFAAWLRNHFENGPPAPKLNELGEPVE